MSSNEPEASPTISDNPKAIQYTESGLPILIPNLKPLPPDVWKPTKHLARPEPPPPPPDLGPAAGQSFRRWSLRSLRKSRSNIFFNLIMTL